MSQYVFWPLGETSPTLGPQSLPRHIEGVLNFDKYETPWEYQWFPVQFVTVPDGKVLTDINYTLDGNVCNQTGTLVDYVAPPEPIPQEVSEAQFISACVLSGIITFEEGKNYLARGELPALMQGVLDSLPTEQRVVAELKAIGSATFSREDIIFKALVTSGSFTESQIDQIFILAGTL